MTILSLFLTILLPGCARLPVAGPDAARLTSTVVARLDTELLFAAAPDGKLVAFSRDGVRVAPLPTGESRTISDELPLSLAWSPDGGRLAVAFVRGTESRITVFSADGTKVAETAAGGRVRALFWPASDTLLTFTVEMESHKFGTSCREILLRWPLDGPPERTVLHDVTIRPHLVRKWGAETLMRSVNPSFSPLGDELVYGRIQDPPAFEPYLKVMVRNISSGAEREIVKTGFNDGAARFSADSEELFISNGFGQIRRIASWNGTDKLAAPFSGKVLAVSPDGHHLLADGRLLNDGREVALFPLRSTGEFLGDGRLLILYNGTLFLVSGIEAAVAGPAIPRDKQESLRTLRAWRASGLISAAEYVTAREKVMK